MSEQGGLPTPPPRVSEFEDLGYNATANQH